MCIRDSISPDLYPTFRDGENDDDDDMVEVPKKKARLETSVDVQETDDTVDSSSNAVTRKHEDPPLIEKIKNIYLFDPYSEYDGSIDNDDFNMIERALVKISDSTFASKGANTNYLPYIFKYAFDNVRFNKEMGFEDFHNLMTENYNLDDDKKILIMRFLIKLMFRNYCFTVVFAEIRCV